MKIYFFGSDHFSTFALKGILNSKFRASLVEIYTTNSFKGPNPIVSIANEFSVPVFPIFGKERAQNTLQFNLFSEKTKLDSSSLNPQSILLLCSFPYMIPNNVIDSFSQNCFVVHPSLLPELPGCSPISGAFLENKSKTGSSIIKMSKNHFDAGEIVYQKELLIQKNWRYKELYEKLGVVSLVLVSEFLENFDNLINQKKSQVITEKYTKKSKKNDNFLVPSILSANQMEQRFKAYFGSTLTTVFIFLDRLEDKLFILDCEAISTETFIKDCQSDIPVELANEIPPGTIINGKGFLSKSILLKCKENFLNIKEGYLEQKGNLRLRQSKDIIFKYADRNLMQKSFLGIETSEFFKLIDSQPVAKSHL